MLRILEAQHVCNLFRVHIRGQQGVLCYFRYFDLDEFMRTLACLGFYQIAKIVWRKADFLGKVFHGGQSLLLCRAGVPILVQQLLEAGKDIVVQHLARDELPFIKAHAIIQQHFDIGDYQWFGKFVDGVLQFTGYLVHIVLDDDTLVGGQV